MKILAFTFDVPATTNMPGSPRLFSLCRHLAERHRVTLATFSQGEERLRTFLDEPDAEGVFDDVRILPSPPRPTWWRRQLHRLRQEPYWSTRVRTPDYHRAIRGRVRRMLSDGGYDVLYVDGLANAQYVLDGGVGRPAVIDLHDSLALLYERNARLEDRWIEKLRLRAEARAMARWESSLGSAFTAVVTNSPVDEAHIRSLDPGARTRTIGNGVDSEFFSAKTPPEDGTNLLFTGVMDYGPNEDAAVHFAGEIFPRIREERPDARFHVVGKDPTPTVRALDALPGVSVLGEVPDMRPHLEAAGIFVCPLRWGAGVKNKVLVALAMERPVVATRRSLDGLDLRDGVDLLVADEPADFAARVLELMGDPARARALGRSGRDAVTAAYSWESNARALEDLLLEAVGASPEPVGAASAGGDPSR